MKRIHCFIAAFLFLAFSHAQKAVVNYELVFNRSFERGKDFVHFDSYLNIKNGESWFYSVPAGSLTSSTNSFDVYPPIDSLFSVYKNLEKRKSVFMEPDFSGRQNYYKDSLHPMIWNLIDEVKKIGDFECNKATTIFRGRNYTAWYYKDIPIPNGPWKLGGLPGLIIEVTEENNDMQISLRSVSFITEPKAIFVPSDESRIPDYETYKSQWKELFKRMDANLMASTGKGNCVSCKEQSKSTVNLWEKWPD